MINNLGNIWGDMNKNKKKINRNFKQKNIKIKNTISKSQNNVKKTTYEVFQNIYASKSGQNKTHLALSNNKITGFASVNDGAKKYWGTPTWFLFHSIAARVSNLYYEKNFVKVWDFIKLTCSNIPCPYCRSHALNYVNNVQISKVNTKEKLIDLLYEFHNSVNKKNGKSLYKKEELETYKKANMQKIFNLFNQRFFKSYYQTRQFQDWTKSKYKIKLIEFYNEIKLHFV